MFNLEEVKIRRRAWIKAARIPEARIGWEMADCKDISTADISKIQKWIAAVRKGVVIRATGQMSCGKGLMFWGTPGQGKTTLSLALIQELMRTFSLEEFDVKEGNVLIRPCYFSTFNDILELKSLLMDKLANDDQEVIYEGILGQCPNDAFNIRVLIIDDIGKEHAGLTGWQKNQLHHILRTRFNNGLPTIVTTNVERKDWAGLYGDATESFANEAFTYIPITSIKGDLRK